MLSPILFFILMDSLLAELAQANWGISVKGIYTRSFGHADDVKSEARSKSLDYQNVMQTLVP